MSHAEKHLWEFRWVRDLAMLLVIIVVCVLVYMVRAITLPVLIGLGLAYVFNPLVTFAQRRGRIPRWLSTGGLMAFLLVVILTLLLTVVPSLLAQAANFVRDAPIYLRKLDRVMPFQLEDGIRNLRDRLLEENAPAPGSEAPGNEAPESAPTHGSENAAAQGNTDTTRNTEVADDAAQPPGTVDNDPDSPTASEPGPDDPAKGDTETPNADTEAIEPAAIVDDVLDGPPSVSELGKMVPPEVFAIMQYAMGGLGRAGGILTTAIGMITYITLFVVVMVFCFFFFSTHFEPIVIWFQSFIPASNREKTLKLLAKMDRSVSGFVRGRLIQAAVLMCVLSVGWGIVGVPYWLLLGVIGGLLNLIPYAGVITWPVAVLLATAFYGPDLWWAVALPSFVYILGQSIDGWIVEPLVQGKATDLDPLSVLIAVLVGGSLLGFLGLLIAIPVAACLKIYAQEVVLPKLRMYAQQH